MNTAENVTQAAKELGDLVELFTNEEPNGSEVGKMLTEGAEAGMALYQLQAKVSKPDYAKAGVVFGAVVGGRVATDKVVFSDGSKIRISVEAIPPDEIPTGAPGVPRANDGDSSSPEDGGTTI